MGKRARAHPGLGGSAGGQGGYRKLTAAVAAHLPERLRVAGGGGDYAHPRVAGATQVTLARAEGPPGTPGGASRNRKATGPRHLIVRVGTDAEPLSEALCRGLVQSSVPRLVEVQVVAGTRFADADVSVGRRNDPSDSEVLAQGPGALYVRHPEAGTHSSLDDLAARASEHCVDEAVMLLAVQ